MPLQSKTGTLTPNDSQSSVAVVFELRSVVQGFLENCDAFINSIGGVIVMPAPSTYSASAL
jgi:hypothetical protein